MERYNRTMLAMLRSYVSEQKDDWDLYASALMYVFNKHVYRVQGRRQLI